MSRIVVAAALAALLASCGKDAGRVDFRLTWPDPTGAPEQVFVRGRVRIGGGTAVVQAEPVGPIRFGSEARLDVEGVPNGEGHVFVVEVTEAVDSDVVLYFGESAPFALRPGLETRVDVALELRRPPNAGSSTTAIAIEEGEVVRSPSVHLSLRSDTAVAAEVSNLAGFVGGVQLVELQGLEGSDASCPPRDGRAPAGGCRYRLPWDLSAGVDDDCARRDDCPRQVFVRYRDASGFRSGVASARTILDTRAPEIVDSTITPLVAAATSPVFVQLNLQERILPRDLELTVESGLGVVERLFPADDEPTSTLSYEVRPTGGRWPADRTGARVALTARARDRAGNVTEPPIALGFGVDAEIPRITNATVSPALLAAGVDRFVVDFWLSEVLPGNAISVQTSPIPSSDGGPSPGMALIDGNACELRGRSEAEGRHWRCAIDLGGFDLSGLNGVALPLRVEARDDAGNVGAATPSVRIDTVAPTVIDPASVVYEPGPDNALAVPRIATHGTTIRLRLRFDEPIDERSAPPVVTAEHGSSRLVFDTVELTPNGGEWTAVVDRDLHEDGVYVPRVEVSDPAGNRNTTGGFTTPSVVVDTTADALVVRQDEVSYVRALTRRPTPEPLTDASGVVRFVRAAGPNVFTLGPADPLAPVDSLPGEVFQLAGGQAPSLLQLFADPRGDTLLRQVRARPDGRWDRAGLRLANLDAAEVWAVGLDAAGNASPPVRIQNVWFEATPNPTARGDRPHPVAPSPIELLPFDEARADTSTVPDQADGVAVVRAADLEWTQPAAGAALAPRNEPRIAFDRARGEAILFAGRGRTDTLRLAGRRWEEVIPATTSPSSRERSGMAYDRRRGRVLLFSGTAGFNAPSLDDLWAWDGRDWSQVRTGTVGVPVGRNAPMMTYDPARDRLVMFGGFTSNPTTSRQDTWEFDGDRWTEVVTSTAPGSPINYPLSDYDPVGRRVLMVTRPQGGVHSTWAFDGTDWTRVVAPAGHPRLSGMAFDEARGQAVGFEATNGGMIVYTLTATVWQRVATVPVPDTAIRLGATVFQCFYDPGRRRVVLISPTSLLPPALRSEVYEWDGRRIVRLQSETPPAMAGGSMVWDAAREQAVLFGGNRLGGLTADIDVSDETWLFDGAEWRRPNLAVRPPARWEAAIGYDPLRQRVVLYGGQRTDKTLLDDTWEWDGARWAQVVTSTQPGPRMNGTMTWDAARGQLVMFGGRYLGDGNGSAFVRHADLWAWDGSAWTKLSHSADGPDLGLEPVLVADPSGAALYLVAPTRTGPATELWSWDGNTWRDLGSASGAVMPPTRGGLAAVWNTALDTLMLFGGGDLNTAYFDVWLRGPSGDWVDRTPTTLAPSPRSNSHVVFDPTRAQLFVFGGARTFNTLSNDTWALGRARRPMVRFTVQLPPEVPRDAVQGMQVRAWCGGRAPADPDDPLGAELLAWVDGGWAPLATTLADLPDPSRPGDGLMAHTAPDAAEARRMLGPGNRVFTACAPSGGSALEPARVGLDSAEVRVRYRLP